MAYCEGKINSSGVSATVLEDAQQIIHNPGSQSCAAMLKCTTLLQKEGGAEDLQVLREVYTV